MHWEKLLIISRPRFWIYVFGPFLIGWIAWLDFFSQWDILAGLTQYKTLVTGALLLVAADYFLFSANLFIYGINDLSDDDTDKYNDKKWSYEHSLQTQERTRLARAIIIFAGTEWLLLMLLLVWTQKELYQYEQRRWGIIWLVLFRATAYLYSSPPVRAKAQPLLDGLFNVLYIFPAIIWWLVAWNSIVGFPWLAFVAGWLRAMAMHAYSAIPDIEPDAHAWLATTAVYLGKTQTLRYCALLRAWAAYLWSLFLGLPMLVMWWAYLMMVGASFTGNIMKLYTRFPRINALVGFVVFWLIVVG